MAFPSDIEVSPTNPMSLTGAASQGRMRPYISSAGNVYVVGRGTGSNINKIFVYKHADPGDGLWTLADNANIPSGSTIHGWCTFQAGDLIHIATQQETDDILYHVFSMSSDTFTTENEAVTSAVGTDIDADKAISISLETDGSIIIFYQGASDSNMGAKERVDRAYKPSGGSWTVDQAVDDGGKVSFFLGGIVRGEANKFHLTFKDETNLNALHKSVQDVDGTLSSVETFDSSGMSGGVEFSVIQSVYYDDGGVERITAGTGAATQSGRSSEIDDDGSPDTEEDWAFSDARLKNLNNFALASYAVDEKRVWVVYASNAASSQDGDVFSNSNDDSAGWDGSSNEELDAITCNLITSNVYQRGDDIVLAYVYDDGGTIKYNEKVLRFAVAIADDLNTPWADAVVTDLAVPPPPLLPEFTVIKCYEGVTQ